MTPLPWCWGRGVENPGVQGTQSSPELERTGSQAPYTELTPQSLAPSLHVPT